MRKSIFVIIICFLSFFSIGQTLSPLRAVNWKLAGHKGAYISPALVIDFIDEGGVNNGLVPNDSILTAVLSGIGNTPAIIYFPAGNYLFKKRINLNKSVILRGKSSDSTTFSFNMLSESDLIYVYGSTTSTETMIVNDLVKDSSRMLVSNASSFSKGNFVIIIENDTTLVTSSWAMRTTGQILKIDTVVGNYIWFESPFRRGFFVSRGAKIKKLNLVKDVGIENIKLLPSNATTSQTNNISFYCASNCWVKCIKSINCNYAHIDIGTSSNIVVTGSYFQDAFSYGDGGKGYGVMINSTTGECLVMDNIFKHLRHSMIFQSGANGNVFAYNYSREPYWTDVTLPSGSAGDMVLHGNYPYCNLFEGNCGQNIVVDDSHGKNGMYNTYFRNRAEYYGIFMNFNPATDYMNFIGNEVTNTGFLLGLNSIYGNNHFRYGNNIKGTIDPSGTGNLPEVSLFLDFTPSYYLTNSHWPPVGPPNTINTYKNEAYNRYLAGQYNDCNVDEIIVSVSEADNSKVVSIYPNPSKNFIFIDTPDYNEIDEISLFSSSGQKLTSYFMTNTIDISFLNSGLYFIQIRLQNGSSVMRKIIKY
jgi:hypothetical protein